MNNNVDSSLLWAEDPQGSFLLDDIGWKNVFYHSNIGESAALLCGSMILSEPWMFDDEVSDLVVYKATKTGKVFKTVLYLFQVVDSDQDFLKHSFIAGSCAGWEQVC